MQHCGVINVGCQGYLASSFISSHRLSQVQNQFTNIWWNLFKWNVFLLRAWTVKKLFLHHMIIMQTWQRHKRKETAFIKKKPISSFEHVFNFLWFFFSFTKTWKFLSFRLKKIFSTAVIGGYKCFVFFFFSPSLLAAQSHILCIVFNSGTSFKLKASW